jgi:hypothetical protein
VMNTKSAVKPREIQMTILDLGRAELGARAFSLLVYTGQPTSTRLFLKKRCTSLPGLCRVEVKML